MTDPERLLAVVSTVEEHEGGPYRYTTSIVIIDPQTDRQISRQDFSRTGYPDARVRVQPASVEGNRAYVVQWSFREDPDGVVLQYLLVHPDGRATARSYTLIDQVMAPIPDYQYGRSYAGYTATDFNTVSNAGNLLKLQDGNLIIENVFTGVQHQVSSAPKHHFTERVHVIWNSTGSHAFIIGTSGQDEQSRLFVLSVADRRLYDMGETAAPFGSLYGLDMSSLQWSPDGRHGIWWDSSNIYTISVDDLKPRRLLSRDRELNDGNDLIAANWLSGSELFILWYEGDVMSQPPHRQSRLYQIDLYGTDTQIVSSNRVTFGSAGNEVAISPDQRYLATIYDGPVTLDIQNNQVRRFDSITARDDTFMFGAITWSPDSNWLLAMDQAGMASGGGGRGAYAGVVRRDGNHTRLLSKVPFASAVPAAFANWVPEQVDPANLAEPLPNPIDPVPVERIAAPDTVYGNIRWRIDEASRRYVPFRNLQDDYVDAEVFTSPKVTYYVQGLNVIDAQSGETIKIVSYGLSYYAVYEAETAAFTSDERLLAVSERWGGIGIYETKTWEMVGFVPKGTLSISFSPDDRYLAVSNLSWIDVYQVRDLVTW